MAVAIPYPPPEEKRPIIGFESLFAPEPARDAALGLGSPVLDLAVKLVNLLHRLGLGVLRVGLGLALGFRVLLVCGSDLFDGGVFVRTNY